MNLIEQMNVKFNEALKQTTFSGSPSTNWMDQATGALLLTSPAVLVIPAKDYAALCAWRSNSLTLLEFATLSNNLETRSPKDLGLPLEKYVPLMTEQADLVAQWNVQVNQLRGDIQKTFAEKSKENEAQAEPTAESDVIPMVNSAVKAEA